jgi:hypothetical protein
MADFLFYVILLALLAFVAVAGYWLVRNYMNGVSPVAALFGPRPERRLAVVEQASVDGRRRLLLIRRDDVEHLIMTGGPVDVVIETGIHPQRAPAAATPEPDLAAPIFSRQPRSLGQTAGERAAE